MKYGIQKNLWDEYLRKMGGWDKFPSDDGLDKADADEIKVRLRRMCDTMAYISNVSNFRMVFQERSIEKLCRNDFYEELRNPNLSEWWKKIQKKCGIIDDAVNYFAELTEKIDRIDENLSEIPEISAQICETILQIQEIESQIFGYIKQVITRLNSNWGKNKEPPPIYSPKNKSNSKIEDFIPLYLGGAEQERALDFITYLRTNKIALRGGGTMNVWDAYCKGNRICQINLHWGRSNYGNNTTWSIILRLDRINEYQETILSEGMQNIIWDNVRYCGFCSYHCHTGDAVVLGKKFRNLCYGSESNTTMFRINNPDTATLNGIKRLLELEKMARVNN